VEARLRDERRVFGGGGAKSACSSSGCDLGHLPLNLAGRRVVRDGIAGAKPPAAAHQASSNRDGAACAACGMRTRRRATQVGGHAYQKKK
jgi:hypothetical protein